jgi:hypothetical protein
MLQSFFGCPLAHRAEAGSIAAGMPPEYAFFLRIDDDYHYFTT